MLEEADFKNYSVQTEIPVIHEHVDIENSFKVACLAHNNVSKRMKKSFLYEVFKRTLDVVCSSLALIVLSPLLLIVIVMIKATSEGPAVFSQERVGKSGKLFKMYKFRTMVKDAESLKEQLLHKNEMSGPMFKIKGDPRITKIGNILRKTSIDELPQLVNVLLGQMSLVGPRPNLPDEVKKFKDYHLLKCYSKPGLTCFWQVLGRNNIGFERWMRLDITYNIRRNFMLDLKLIFRTVLLLLGDKHAH